MVLGQLPTFDSATLDALTSYIPQVIPEAVLLVVACVLFLGSTWVSSRTLWGTVALVGLVLAGVGVWYTADTIPTTDSQQERLEGISQEIADSPELPKLIQLEEKKAKLEQELRTQQYSAPLEHSRFTLLVKLIALAAGLVLLLYTWDEIPAKWTAEHHACLLLIVAGVGLAAASNELITLFLALELVSIPTYVLLYMPRADAPAQEAALKYFLLSVFSSGLLLFGFSYLYGIAGSTNLAAINEAVGIANTKDSLRGLPIIALVTIVAGLGFKITAVPFHFYAPDVYQGTSTSGAALLAFVPKVAGFAVLARILGVIPQSFSPVLAEQTQILIWIIAAVTMTLGNILALLQNNVKRLLAYSSVAHAGYMLMGIAVAMAPRYVAEKTPLVGGIEAVLFYLIAYGAMTIGAFAVLSWLDTEERPVETVDDLSGLGRSHPKTALIMVVFLFSLIGLPLTAGFIGKLMLFLGVLSVPSAPGNAEAMEQSRLFITLGVIAALNAAIGAWYYLRIAAVMYLRDSLQPLEPRRRTPILAAIGICVAITLTAGVYPKPLMDGVERAVNSVDELPRPESEARAQE